MAAAVADFRPRNVARVKIARDGAGLTLELEPTTDILAEVVSGRAPRTRPPVVVGFAAETGSLERARDKAARKGVDLLVANDVAEEGSGFGTDTNRVTLVVPGGDGRGVAADVQAPGRGPALGPGHPRTRRAHPFGCRIGRHMSAITQTSATDHRRHHQAVRRRPAFPDAHGVRLPDGASSSTRPASRSSSWATRSRR